jgi:hypothetical protein
MIRRPAADKETGGIMSTVRRSRLLLVALAAASVVATLFGLSFLMGFDQTPGARAGAPVRWPASSAVQRAGGRPALLVFAHPFCGCTEATLGELAKITARRARKSPRPAITILLTRPKGSAWQRSPLWDDARRLIGANVVWDEDGREARLFQVLTSGEVLLYGPGGELLFEGGVTGSRGHAGDNYGAAGLAAALDSGLPAKTAHPVFGCALAASGLRAAAKARP